MRKSLSLVLTAALALGSAMPAFGAPLAKKATANGPKKAPVAEATATPGKARVLPLTRSFAAEQLSAGIAKDKSGMTIQRKRAERSAKAASNRSVAASVDLRGVIVYSDAWVDEAEYGLYTVPTTDGAQFEMIAPFDYGYQLSYDDNDGTFWGFSYTSFWGLFDIFSIDQISTDDWHVVGTNPSEASLFGSDQALDPVTGEVYGCYYNDNLNGYVWGKVDYTAQTRTAISDLPDMLIGVGADKDGQYYAIDYSGDFYKVEKTTGQMTLIGSTGIEMQYTTGGCVNDKNGTFLVSNNTDTEAALWEIDLATAEATKLCDFPDGIEVCGLYIAKPAAEDKAPAAPELTAECENGAMAAKLTLVMPTTLFDGTPAEGEFTYTVIADGVKVLEGTAAAGATVEETVEMDASGKTEFVAYCTNATGNSPKAKTSCYIGKGTPAAPATVKLTWAEGNSTLTWDAVTESADGGYLNAAEVTYSVFDGEGTLLAEGLTETTYTTAYAEPTDYTVIGYSVSAQYDGKTSGKKASNTVGLGAFNAPFTMEINTADKFALHTILDANEDESTWMFDGEKIYCKYHGANDSDDWLFSPNIKLEAGKAYEFSAVLAAGSTTYVPETIEIFMGKGATVEAQTVEVVPATNFTTKTPTTVKGVLKPTEDGVYNIGFHCISPADKLRLELHSYTIGEALNPTAPAAVTDMKVTAAENGDLKATLACKAPAKAIDGSDLTGDVTVKIYRGETLAAEVTGAAGADLTAEDTLEEIGTYTYTFVTSNAAGEGLSATASAFIGPRTPATVKNAEGAENTFGTVVFTWDPVTADVNGLPIASEYIKYNVYSTETTSTGLALGDLLTTEPISETTFTIANEQEEQDFLYIGITTDNRGVESNPVAAAALIGKPYDMPVAYTNTASLDDYFLIYGGDGSLTWGSSALGVPAQDGDDTYFAIKNNYLDDATYLETGKILISGDKPVLKYYSIAIADDDPNETIVSVECDGQETELLSYVNNEMLTADDWTAVKVDLSAFTGKTVQIKITSVCKNYLYGLFDNIKVCNDLDYDLTAKIAAPAKVKTGETFDINVDITNDGAQDADEFTVELYRDDELVDTQDFHYGVATEEKENAIFKQTLTLTDPESVTYHAVVVFADDQAKDNNTTATVTVTRNLSKLPKVEGLEGSANELGNVLTWNPVVIGEKVPTEVTEDFEDAEAWADEFADWTFIDVDGAADGGFQGIDLPNHPVQGTSSFYVFDAEDPAILASNSPATYAAHSGTKYLASMYAYDDSAVDNWAISPLLTGEAQTISFFARSYSSQYPEAIEIYYTTANSVDTDDYTLLESVSPVPADWTEYTYDLPAGATHFAVRSCAAGAFMLMLDDFTFTKLDGFDGELLGYNVYCDGQKLNDAPLTEAAYTHVGGNEADHTYAVTAVYDKGESELSDPVTLEQAGINQVFTKAMKVYTDGQAIVVAGAAGKMVTISTVDGKVLYHAAGDAKFEVTKAVYLVTVDGKTTKLIVR